MNLFQQSFRRWHPLFWPALACIVGWQRMAGRFDSAVQFDAEQIYLPAARQVLEQGWSYLLSPESYRVVPLSYLWPALWLGETEWIRLANCGLWALCICFLWSTSRQLGGIRCGAVAMILWTANPEIYRYFPTELTEPIFLLGLTGWTWALVSLILSPKPGRLLIWLAAIALCITLLSRPVLQLIAPAGLVACLGFMICSWKHKPGVLPLPDRQRIRAIAISLALGMLLPVLLMIKNGLVFGLWGLGTGAGTGLYLGTHPLFQGTEPAYLGFDYDNNLLAHLTSNNGDHLNLEADRAARAVGIWQVHNMSLLEGAKFFSRKLWWWLAHHPASLHLYGDTLRKLRLLEITAIVFTLALAARAWLRGGWQAVVASMPDPGHIPRHRLAAAAVLLLLFGLMLGQLLPILYNSRYSTALLDPWTVVLAAFSITAVMAPLRLEIKPQSWTLFAKGRSHLVLALARPFALVVTAAALFNYAKRHEAVAIDQPAETEVLVELPANRIDTLYLTSLGGNRWAMNDDIAVLSLSLSPSDLASIRERAPDNAMWRIDLALARKTGRCKPSDIAYQLDDGHILNHSQLQFKADGRIHAAYVHGNQSLRPSQPGRLRIVLKCPAGTEITWAGTAFLNSIHPQVAAQALKTIGQP